MTFLDTGSPDLLCFLAISKGWQTCQIAGGKFAQPIKQGYPKPIEISQATRKMQVLKKLALAVLIVLILIIIAVNSWGYLTLGKLEPAAAGGRDKEANRVVMVFGATGSVGDGLLKAAIEDAEVEKIYVVSRRRSPRIDAGVASGRAPSSIMQTASHTPGLT